jgi:hypothetical protein
VLCILAQLYETEAGLAFVNGNDYILLSTIIDELSGAKCKYLIGKPKLCFFLDGGTKQDKNSTLSLQV